jgi:hypothetical protein
MERGLPRPLLKINKISEYVSEDPKWNNRRYPVPYTAREGRSGIALISDERAKECVIDWVCFVCGNEVKPDETWALAKGKDLNTDHGEAGPYHKVCLDIAMKMCPHIAEGTYFAVEMHKTELMPDVANFW